MHIDKTKDVGFRVCDEVMVAYLPITISKMYWLIVFIPGPMSAHAEPYVILNTYSYLLTSLDTMS